MKVKLSRYRHAASKEERKYCSLFLSSAVGGAGQRHASAALYPGTHSAGGWVDLIAGLDTEVRNIIKMSR
jgi:hypothetical protein